MTGHQNGNAIFLIQVQKNLPHFNNALRVKSVDRLVGSVTVVRMMGAELTYFTWHFTLTPVFFCMIPLIIITALVPLFCYNKMAQKTVVERLRIAE